MFVFVVADRFLLDVDVDRMYEVFEDLNHLYIVMEICSGGELFDRIKEQGAYSELDASKVLRQMFEGVNYLHSKQVSTVSFVILLCQFASSTHFTSVLLFRLLTAI